MPSNTTRIRRCQDWRDQTREWREIQEFAAECRRLWPGAKITLQPNETHSPHRAEHHNGAMSFAAFGQPRAHGAPPSPQTQPAPALQLQPTENRNE